MTSVLAAYALANKIQAFFNIKTYFEFFVLALIVYD